MSIIVCIKQVPDTETKVHINSTASWIDEENIQWILNPYDEFALEEAIQLKEKAGNHKDFSIKVITLGPKRVKEALFKALAQGADEAIHIEVDLRLDSFATAKALSQVIKKEVEKDPLKVIFTGTLAIDDSASSVPQMIAEFLNLPHVTFVSKFEFFFDSENSGCSENSKSVKDLGDSKESKGNRESRILVERDVEQGGREQIEIQGPAIIAANKGLNLPRSINLPAMMRAKRKPFRTEIFQDLGLTDKVIKTEYFDFKLPRERKSIHWVEESSAKASVAELVRLLREEAKVI